MSETRMYGAGVPGSGLSLPVGGLLRAPRGLHRLAVATDFSLGADFALARALRLPFAHEATLGLLHVRPSEGPHAQGVSPPVERCLHRTGLAARRRLRARADIAVHEAVREGEPSEGTDAYARQARAELVVVGRPHLGPGRSLRPDSTVRHLVRGVRAPLLVVVPHPSKPYQQPLVAVDFSRDSRRALELTLRLCPPPTRVGVVHVFRRPEPGVDTRMARLLREQEDERAARVALGRFLAPYREVGREFELFVREDAPLEGLLGEADEVGADLLALGMAEGTEPPGLAERVLGVACDVLVAKVPPP
ncbi:universal stress protein [Myxococcaceae bacterium GXIMD 01537]